MKRLNEIFDIQYGNQFDFSKMETCDLKQGINFISRSSQNNGVMAKVKKYKNIKPFESGLITVTLGGSYLLTSFVQPEPFYTAQNIKVLKPRIKMSLQEKLYYCCIIEHNRFRYTSHAREANSTFDNILVPAYDSLPSNIKKYNICNPYNSKSVTNKEIELNTQNWKYFYLKDIFKFEKCKCSKAKEFLEDGNDIAYVGAKKSNNGIVRYVKYEVKYITKGNCLVFIGDGQGSVGYSNYQPIDFIGTTTLHVGRNDFLNKYNAMFLVAILDLERYRYSFGRKYKPYKTKVKLPALICENGQYVPDWQFMEEYIKSLSYSKNLQ